MKQPIYLRLFILLISFLISQSYYQGIAQTTQFRLLIFGQPSLSNDNIVSFVGQKWDIEFVRVAGCDVTKALVDSVRIHNNEVEALVADKYGKDWRIKFDEAVQQEFKNQQLVNSLIDESEFIQHWKMQMEKDSIFISYELIPISNSALYKAVIKGLDAKKRENKVYFNLIIDYSKRIVSIE